MRRMSPIAAATILKEHMSTFGAEIPVDQIVIIKEGASKHDALDALIAAVCRNPAVTDCEAFSQAVYAREGVQSTGIGGGIAVPHVRIPEVTTPTLGVGIAPEGIDFGTLDNQPVHILVIFATPESAQKEYLGLLAQVMLALRDKQLFDGLLACKTPEEVHALLAGG